MALRKTMEFVISSTGIHVFAINFLRLRCKTSSILMYCKLVHYSNLAGVDMLGVFLKHTEEELLHFTREQNWFNRFTS